MKFLWLLSRLIAFAGIAFVTFQYGLRGLLVSVSVGIVLPWLGKLASARNKGRKHPPASSGPMKWRPQVDLLSVISGVLGGLGGVVLLQQYSLAVLTGSLLMRGVISGLLAGLILPSIVWVFVVRIYNRKLGKPGSGGTAILPAATRMMLVLITVIVAVLSMAAPALAELSGPCALIVGGRNARGMSITDPKDAYLVGTSGSVPIIFTAPSEVTVIDSQIRYAGGPIPFVSGSERSSGSGSVEVAFDIPVGIARRVASGVYEMHADLVLADGRRCSAAFLFRFDASDPLTSGMGALAATTAAMAVAGTLLPSIRKGAETVGSLDYKLSTVGPSSGGRPTSSHDESAFDALIEAGGQTAAVGGLAYLMDPSLKTDEGEEEEAAPVSTTQSPVDVGDVIDTSGAVVESILDPMTEHAQTAEKVGSYTADLQKELPKDTSSEDPSTSTQPPASPSEERTDED